MYIYIHTEFGPNWFFCFYKRNTRIDFVQYFLIENLNLKRSLKVFSNECARTLVFCIGNNFVIASPIKKKYDEILIF